MVEFDLNDIPNLSNLYIEDCGFLIIDLDDIVSVPDNYTNQFLNDDHTVIKLNFAGGMICKKGHITLKINFKEITVKENEILVCRSGMHVELLDVSEDVNLTAILYANSYSFDEMSSRQFVQFNSFFHDCDSTMKVTPLEMERCLQVINTLKMFLRIPDFVGKREIIKCFSKVLIQGGYNALLKNNPDVRHTNGSRRESICQDFLHLLKLHYAESRKVSFYADKLCISPKHLSKMILKGTGKHITEWIDGYVMLEAQSLLRTGKYNVQEVSDKLNFANQSFFGTWFRKHAGISPSEFIGKD